MSTEYQITKKKKFKQTKKKRVGSLYYSRTLVISCLTLTKCLHNLR